MRITKDPEVRRNEIITAAKALFEEKGYQHTKVIDITRSIDVAKGTFYHYFETKEDVLKAIVERLQSEIIEAVQGIEAMPVSGLEKIRILLHSDRITDEITKDTIEHLEMPENRELQEQTAVAYIQALTPYIVQFLEQAHAEGTIGTIDHAKEKVEIILAAGHFLIDSGLFDRDPDAKAKRLYALWDTFERMFEIPDTPFTSSL